MMDQLSEILARVKHIENMITQLVNMKLTLEEKHDLLRRINEPDEPTGDIPIN